MTWQALIQFHFLRPEWLLLLPVTLVIILFVRRRDDVRSQWSHIIAPHLLDHLLAGEKGRLRLRPVHLVSVLLPLSAIALAGPTWQRELPPFAEDRAPMVAVLTLSRTMDAIDVQPTRLERAKQKIRDLLALRTGSRTALFVYAGTAHMVLPLTDDPSLIETFLAALSTDLMPTDGNDAAAALEAVDELLAREETPGTILFLCDGIDPAQAPAFAEHQRRSNDEILVLGVGTSRGGPISLGENRFLTDRTGARVTARLDVEALRRFGSDTGIPVMTTTLDSDDVDWIERRAQTHLQIAQQESAPERWRDFGYYLVFPVALLAALWFRRGWTVRWLPAVVVLLTLGTAAPARAEFRFVDLFLTADQQGRYYFEQGDNAAAAERFEDPLWKGLALYRADDFENAVNQFALLDSAEGYFHLGNCQARLADYPAAVASYDEALKRKPGFPEADANRKLVASLIPPEKEPDDGETAADPNLAPDEIKFDDKGKKGKEGQIEATAFSADQMAEIWMRGIQTTPAGFLRRKFAIQSDDRRPAP